MESSKLSRRNFLKAAGMLGAGAALAACQPAATPAPAATSAPVATAKPAAKAVELNLSVTDYFDTTKKVFEEKVFPDLKKTNPEITVKINYTAWNKYNEELTTAFAGGVPPDVMSGGAIFVPQFGQRDWTLPLDNYVNAAKEWDWQDFLAPLRDDVNYKGKVMAVPYLIDTRTLWYRKDHLKEAGVNEPPATWDDLRKVAIACTKKEGDKITRSGFHFIPITSNWQNDFQVYMALMGAAQGKLISDDLKKSMATEAPSIETAEFMRKLVMEDKCALYPPFDDQGQLSAVTVGKASMMVSGPGTESVAKANAPDQLPNLSAALPAKNKAQATHVWINKYFIAKPTKNPDPSWVLLSHLTSKANLELFCESLTTIPPRASLGNAKYLSDNLKTFAKAAQNATVYPKYHRMPEVFRPMATALEAILRGQKSSMDAMKEAAAAIDKLLAEG
jgi:multiple sugar transport system substrate-binding protein